MSHPTGPHSQPPDHLPTDRSIVNEHELVRPILNSDIFDKEDTQPQEEEQEDESPGLANYDPSLEPSGDRVESYSDSYTDEFNNNPESDEDDGRPSPIKRKRRSSSNIGPTHKKRKHHLEQRSTQHRPRSKPYQHYPKSHSPLSREGQLPSPTPSAP
jgi:hypothetical protein